jgi:hypothetical protein
MSRLLVAALALTLAACGSKCDPACAVLADTQCPHVQFNGVVRTASEDDCSSDCRNNNESICADSSDASKNAQVLDCVAAIDCEAQSSQQLSLALEQCVVLCPTHR